LIRPGDPIDPAELVRVLTTRGYVPSEDLLWWESHINNAPIAGPALAGRDGLLRAPNAQPLEGLYHVGTAAHPGPGLTLAPLSAALVAETLGRAR
jgi:phytoene dehydrogenase-like protein